MADSLDLMRAKRVATSEAAIVERNNAMHQILRWCDRQGEEPEGQCLYEIEQICRKQLGLELLVLSEPQTVNTCCECREDAVGFAEGFPYCAVHYQSRIPMPDIANKGS